MPRFVFAVHTLMFVLAVHSHVHSHAVHTVTSKAGLDTLRNFFVSLLSSIDSQCYDHFVSYMLRPLLCLTMFCDHNFSLVCRFNLQFSQNYINIDTDEIQHWFSYLVQSLWNKNTIYERSNSRTFYHIFIPYTNTLFFLFHIVLYTIMKSTYNVCTHGCIHTNLNNKWPLLSKKITSEENACRTRKFLCSVKVIN